MARDNFENPEQEPEIKIKGSRWGFSTLKSFDINIIATR